MVNSSPRTAMNSKSSIVMGSRTSLSFVRPKVKRGRRCLILHSGEGQAAELFEHLKNGLGPRGQRHFKTKVAAAVAPELRRGPPATVVQPLFFDGLHFVGLPPPHQALGQTFAGLHVN